MHIDGVLSQLRDLNAAARTAAKPKVKKVKPNGKAELTPEEWFRISAERIVTAFGMRERGVTVEAVVAAVQSYEQPYQGVIQ